MRGRSRPTGRDAGLQVGLVEHTLSDGRPGGCVLVARSPTRVLHRACCLATARDGRPLGPSRSRSGAAGTTATGSSTSASGRWGPRSRGRAGRRGRQVLGWIHGGDTLEAGPEAAPVPSASGGAGGRRASPGAAPGSGR